MLETNAITRRADVAINGNSVSNALPPQSVSLWVIAGGGVPARLRANAMSATNTLMATIFATTGQRYVIEGSTNTANTNWTPVVTNTMASTNQSLALPANSPQRFYRARWLP